MFSATNLLIYRLVTSSFWESKLSHTNIKALLATKWPINLNCFRRILRQLARTFRSMQYEFRSERPISKYVTRTIPIRPSDAIKIIATL